MFTLNLKPAHKAVQAYYEELHTLGHLNFYAEGAVSPAFAALLRHCAKQCGLTSDPNRDGDPQYIVRLLGQIITVSLETLQLIDSLPPLD
jgi:hypothetical protein